MRKLDFCLISYHNHQYLIFTQKIMGKKVNIFKGLQISSSEFNREFKSNTALKVKSDHTFPGFSIQVTKIFPSIVRCTKTVRVLFCIAIQ